MADMIWDVNTQGKSKHDIVEFLTERLTEWKREAELEISMWAPGTAPESNYAVVALVNSQLKIVEWHKQWPVLVEEPPEINTLDDYDPLRINSVSYQMIQRIQWMTQEEYVIRFGKHPPTAPHLLEMLKMFEDHPDFWQGWLQ